MILFSIITAALVFIALIFLLPPLLGKTRNSAVERKARDARKALKNASDADRKRIAEELLLSIENEEKEQETGTPVIARAGAAIVGLAVPLLALGMYMWLGSPALISGKAATTTASSHEAGGMTMAQAIAKLEQRLEEDPDNAEGWFMLARSYVAEKEFTKAAHAMERVLEIEGDDDPQLLLQYADALAMANGGRVAGKPEAVIHKALKLKPDYPEALWLAGIAESQNDRIPQALVYWRKAVALLEDQPDAQAELKNQIALAEKKLKSLGGETSTATQIATAPQVKSAPAAEVAASISVTVSLGEAVAANARPDDAVFIYARAASGPPMPLAATRTTVSALPVTVTLDDSQAMMPQMKLSSFPQVIVGARISKSGQAIPQPGDLEGSTGPLDVHATKETTVTIDRVH